MFRPLHHTSATPLGPHRPGIARLLVWVLLCAAWVCLSGRSAAAAPGMDGERELRNAHAAVGAPAATASEQCAGFLANEEDRAVATHGSEDHLVAERTAEAEEDWTTAAAAELRRIAPPGQRRPRRHCDPMLDRSIRRLAPARAPPVGGCSAA